MKKLIFFITMISFGFMGASSVNADVTFYPTPIDMYDLDHYDYYIWTIDLGLDSSIDPITEASLVFNSIINWREEDNIMYIHLLDADDSDTVGLEPFDDNVSGLSDAFLPDDVLIAEWEDTDYDANDETFYFSDVPGLLDTLNLYAEDGIIAIGIDPDCHYLNDGVSLTISAVPAPGAVVLSSLGLGLVGWLRRRRSL